MSHPPLPRKPAWEGLIPSEPVFHITPEPLSRHILSSLNLSGKLYQCSVNNEQTDGYYKFIPENNTTVLFIKIISEEHAVIQASAQKIADYLAGKGLATNTLIHGFPQQLDDGNVVLAYEFISGRFCRPNDPEDFSAAGSMLARLHTALKTYPEKRRVPDAQAHRLEQIQLGQDIIRESKITPPSEDLARIIIESSISLDFIEGEKQMIHGDLNFGNLIFIENNQPLILDFEDCSLSWLATWVDLAMFIERFLLIHKLDMNTVRKCATNFFYHYEKYGDKIPAVDAETLSKILKTLSVRALCLLSNLEYQGIKQNDNEWKKFEDLYQMPDNNPEMLEVITQCIPRPQT